MVLLSTGIENVLLVSESLGLSILPSWAFKMIKTIQNAFLRPIAAFLFPRNMYIQDSGSTYAIEVNW